jgi:transcriptional regulator of acetoin/glycerol metabolism
MNPTRPTVTRGLHGVTAAQPTNAILRSWERCSALDATLHADPNPMSAPELSERQEQHAHVLETARPELQTLADLVTSAHGVVLLADPTGVILHETGSTDFLRKAERVALRPGVSWAEAIRGTNAIGTALYEGAAVRVHGNEHFLRCNRILSCHAAPVFSPSGEIMGVLDISSDAATLQAYALGLAQMCARQISNRMLERSDARFHRLVFQRQASLLESAERAVLLLEDERIVGANEAALQILGADWSMLRDSVNDWIDGSSRLGETPQQVLTIDGILLVATLRHGRSPSVRPALMPAPARPAKPASVPSAQPTTVQYDQGNEARACLRQAVDALNAGLAVLLQGETGVGKEIFARRLHQQSAFQAGPFIAVNCGALPESLIESELFGYEGGAFTGARREGSLGRLREAHGGVLFLDEIGDMPLVLQTRLLRSLQEREVQPLGSNKRIPVEFALVSATNRDLRAMLAQGAFRSDLFYRLQDYKASLPALRQRSDLRNFLCQEFKRMGGMERAMTLSDSALDALTRYAWPGNYREMRSILCGLLFLKPVGSRLHARDLPPELKRVDAGAEASSLTASEPPSNGVQNSGTLRDLNSQRIFSVLNDCDQNISRAAGVLGIHRSTLHRYLARNQAQHGTQKGVRPSSGSDPL